MNSTYNPYVVLPRSKPIFSIWSRYLHSLSLRRGLSEIVDWDRRRRHIRIWHLRKRRHRSSATPWIRVTHYHPRSYPIHRQYRLYRRRRSRSHYNRRGSDIQPSLLPQNSISSRSLLSSDIIPQSFHFLFLRQNLLLHEKFHFVELVELLLVVHLGLRSIRSRWTSSTSLVLLVFGDAKGAA